MRLILKVGLEKEIPCKENKLVKTWFLSLTPLVCCASLEGEKTIFIMGRERT